ncbi:von Willebrand factor A domain-containing protein [Yasminevirus sp. GU-2018]|uniref:von Willebrand factor A domain-containing protein n=1 Tax=Yasminevirus sp. GU-2018 TaxID=2420051 RepID=A0A5K0UAB5_9VIRU|nr:von Willebrand factor A domain-containing protein [Yasminevirus sp. GU-2018]
MLRSSGRTSTNIPLKSQKIHVDVKDRVSCITVTQNYVNEEENPIEAFYTFPTPAESSVFHFEAKNENGKVIIALCKEKIQAKKEYNKAIKEGNTAYYMDRSEGGSFSVAVGNLAPGAKISICIKLVTELPNEENCRKIRLNIPLTMMSKYVPSYQTKPSYQHKSKLFVNKVSNPSKVGKRPYDMSISGDIFVSSKLVSIDSKTHKIRLSTMHEKGAHFDIDDIDELNKDVVLTIEREWSSTTAFTQEIVSDLKNPYLRHCTVVNVVPDFSKMPPVNVKDVHYCILLDRSGSMGTTDMEICKTAAKQFIALIPFGATFDVCSFDDLFEKYEGAKDESPIQRRANASSWVERLYSRGGTEILPALREIYGSVDKTRNTVIIVLSDGGVSNTDDVLKYVKGNPNVSVFTIGIGSSVSQDLIRGMATNGNGVAEFIGSGDKDILQKVRSQLKKSQETLRKHQNHYTIEVVTSGGAHRIVPEKFAPLYENTDNTFYVFSEFPPVQIVYTQFEDNKSEQSSKTIKLIVPQKVDTLNISSHRIAGVKLINELQTIETENLKTDYSYKSHRASRLEHMRVEDDVEDEIEKQEKAKAEIISISTDLNVLSNHTAFIGVDKKVDKITGDLELRAVPLQIAERETALRYEDSFESYSPPKCASACASAKASFSRSKVFVPLARSGGHAYAEEEAEECDFGEEECAEEEEGDMGFGLFDDEPAVTHVVMQSVSSNWGDAPDLTAREIPSKNSSSAKSSQSNIVLAIDIVLPSLDFGGVISGKENGSFLEFLEKLLASSGANKELRKKLKKGLKVGDYIKLCSGKSTDGVYEVVSLGSVDEPWVLQLVRD